MGEFPTWLVDTAIVLPGLIVVMTPITWLLRREVRRMKSDLVDEVRQRTYPIQPTANGGRAMPDLFHRLDTQDANLEILTRAVLEHIADDEAHNA